uniref:Uncharacterized protein n=1 Tax=Macaca nemestrina TaxID=9545 RepID=A0A2K6CKC3_MACNE
MARPGNPCQFSVEARLESWVPVWWKLGEPRTGLAPLPWQTLPLPLALDVFAGVFSLAQVWVGGAHRKLSLLLPKLECLQRAVGGGAGALDLETANVSSMWNPYVCVCVVSPRPVT